MESYSQLVKQHVRLSGVLLHPTSFPSGVLGKDADRWLDFMEEAGLSVWQVLPLGAPQENLSPYQCYSAFAMNPALLDDDQYKTQNFDHPDYQEWLIEQEYWIHDYVLFMSLKTTFNLSPWYEWPEEYRLRDEKALDLYKINHSEQISAIYWQQFCLYQRWGEIQRSAHQKSIMLFGDMPIFVAHDSADTWMNPESFLLDESSQPSVVAGVPPDYFSDTGQRWGNPHYNWEQMRKNKFKWWIQRIKNHLSIFDLVRIDHFRGLEAVWVIPQDCETAIDGEWQKVPGEEFLDHLKQELGDLAIVAEDLGIITPEVNKLREKFQLPGMSVLQFSFDGFEDNPHKPQNITYDRIVYSGTHDNDTSQGWFNDQSEETQNYIMQIIEVSDPSEVTDKMLDIIFNSAGQLAIAPLQDLLGLGSEARMNVPGVSEDNWSWKFNWDQISHDLANTTRNRLDAAGRLFKTEIN